MKLLIAITTFLMCGLLTNLTAQAPVYGLEGWAATTVGGQGGNIIRVTNLNASGAGSLKDALLQTGNRIIVFEVGGTINLNGQTLSIKQPHVTIAGQTAPSPGINLINGAIFIQTHDVILQHIRMRVGAATQSMGWEKDGISTYIANNIAIDHCSVTWAVDENCSASGPRFEGITPDDWRANTSHDITISNCIIAEGLSNATHTKGEHSKGSLIHDNATNIAILKNLYISNKDRNPLFKGGARGVIVNNYILNPGSAAIKFGLVDSEWTGYEWQEAQMTVIGNVMQYGPDTGNIPLVKAGNGPCAIYLEGNEAKDRSGSIVTIYNGSSSNITNTKPTWNDNISVLESSQIKQYLVNQAGARSWDRDAVDNRLINEVVQNTGQIIDYETEVGGFPNLTATTSVFDENDWNLDFMIEKTGLVLVETVNDSYFTNESFEISGNTNAFEADIEYLELLVNHKPVGRVTEIPFTWTISEETIGDIELQIVAKETNGRLHISASKTLSITTPLNISDKNVLETHIYPNPFSDSISLSFANKTPQTIQYELKDILGKTLISNHFNFKSKRKQVYYINTSHLPAGVYCFTLKTDGNTTQNKILILNR